MVTRTKRSGEEGTTSAAGPDLAGMVKESAQQIWLAGLGAFSKAQEEGGKVFQALVKEGLTVQRKTQETAGDTLGEATSRMASMASELSNRAAGQWDRLESLFEERIARTLKKMGVPSARDLDHLSARIDELNRTLAALRSAQGGARTAPHKTAARKPPVQRPMAKAVRKRAAARKAPIE